MPLLSLLTTPLVASGSTWYAQGSLQGARLGSALAVADVNGDGYADLLAGSEQGMAATRPPGDVSLWFGSPLGLSSSPDQVVAGSQPGAAFGARLAATDVNGDGYADVIVAEPSYDGAAGASCGRISVYVGSPTGLAAAPALSIEGDEAPSNFGSVLSAGDVNGDGYGDLVVGVYTQDVTLVDEGAVRVYAGSAAGLAPVPAWTLSVGQAYAWFGNAVSAGDVDGDGYDDLVVGARFYDAGLTDVGGAFLYLGSASGPSPSPVWSVSGATYGLHLGMQVALGDVDGDGEGDVIVATGNYGLDADEVRVFRGSPSGPSTVPDDVLSGPHSFGGTLATGDVDGDGDDDLLVSTVGASDPEPYEGLAELYLGSPAGLDPAPAWREESDQASASYGSALALGDVVADGVPDLVVAAPSYDGRDPQVGAVGVYSDVLVDTDGDGAYDTVDACPAASDPAQLDTDGDGAGNACDTPTLAVVGTVSSGAIVTLVADGAAPGEVVWFAGAPGRGGAGPCPASLGGVCLHLGSPVSLLGSVAADAAGRASLAIRVPAVVAPNGTYALQAAIVRAASVTSPVVALDGTVLDWDADGVVDADELVLHTDPRLADTDGDGLGDGLDQLPEFDPLVPDTDGDGVLDGADRCWYGDDAFDADGDVVPDTCDLCPQTLDPSQADTDLDGLGDACDGAVLVASWAAEPNAPGSAFGSSVASAGDVNADGYDDVIVGAPSEAHGALSGGVARVFLGSAAGLAAAPSWISSGGQVLGAYGASVASAGDVNRDGYDDVAVGSPSWNAPYNQSQAGRVQVYLGSAAGLRSAVAWSTMGVYFENTGTSVASAGDVDGDGDDELLVGSPGWTTGDGRVDLYRGSILGLSSAAAWTATAPGMSSSLGSSVASAGDVNGDGFGDVIAGAPDSSSVGAYAWHGSATGLQATAAWSYAAPLGERFGHSVASAGDVNADGFDDVVVGAPYDRSFGAGSHVYLFLGSPTGLEPDPATILEETRSDAWFGGSVAGAGDVNGDGYDDVVVGARQWDGGQTDEGVARLFLGGPLGLRPAPAWVLEGDQPDAWTGAAVGRAGDVDADGLSDVIVGASRYDGGDTNEGRAVLHRGHRP